MTNFEAKCLAKMTMLGYETVGAYPKAYAACAAVGGVMGGGAVAFAEGDAVSPIATITDAVGKVYDDMLKLSVTVGLVCMVLAGIIYIIPFGDQSWIRTAKNWFVRILVGIAIIAGASILFNFVIKSIHENDTMSETVTDVTG